MHREVNDDMKHVIYIIFIAVILAGCSNTIKIVTPTVEMQDGSMLLATAEPRFSWQYEAEAGNVVQTDYRIIVASSEENARKDIGDLWDSKECVNADASKTDTITRSNNNALNQMLYIPYEGKSLKSRDRCWWKVYTTYW